MAGLLVSTLSLSAMPINFIVEMCSEETYHLLTGDLLLEVDSAGQCRYKQGLFRIIVDKVKIAMMIVHILCG